MTYLVPIASECAFSDCVLLCTCCRALPLQHDAPEGPHSIHLVLKQPPSSGASPSPSSAEAGPSLSATPTRPYATTAAPATSSSAASTSTATAVPAQQTQGSSGGAAADAHEVDAGAAGWESPYAGFFAAFPHLRTPATAMPGFAGLGSVPLSSSGAAGAAAGASAASAAAASALPALTASYNPLIGGVYQAAYSAALAALSVATAAQPSVADSAATTAAPASSDTAASGAAGSAQASGADASAAAAAAAAAGTAAAGAGPQQVVWVPMYVPTYVHPQQVRRRTWCPHAASSPEAPVPRASSARTLAVPGSRSQQPVTSSGGGLSHVPSRPGCFPPQAGLPYSPAYHPGAAWPTAQAGARRGVPPGWGMPGQVCAA
jgi:hypothetical protein